MDFGLYVDDKEGIKIDIGEAEAFIDSTFTGGGKANFPHAHLNLVRDVQPSIMGKSVGSGEITLEPSTQYVIINMETLEMTA